MLSSLSPAPAPSAYHVLVQLHQVNLLLGAGAARVHILHDISLAIQAGETAAIIGPSGSGKTSLLMVMAGLERASSGDVRVAGENLSGLSEDQLARFRARNVSIVFQSFHLIPTMTALQNVTIPLEFARIPDAEKQAKDALGALGLGHRLSHFPSQMSGGEQQRVAIARAFVTRPKLLLADEPTGNLDHETGEQVMKLLFDLKREYGTALLLVTHDMEVARQAGRIIHLSDGRIVSDA